MIPVFPIIIYKQFHSAADDSHSLEHKITIYSSNFPTSVTLRSFLSLHDYAFLIVYLHVVMMRTASLA